MASSSSIASFTTGAVATGAGVGAGVTGVAGMTVDDVVVDVVVDVSDFSKSCASFVNKLSVVGMDILLRECLSCSSLWCLLMKILFASSLRFNALSIA